jgi:hemerythrin-like domain-containing protein
MSKTHSTDEPKRKGIVERIVGAGSETGDEAPEATKMLKEQHDEVRALFKEYDKSGEGAHSNRKRLIDEASDKLEVHSELEEKIFYPACRQLEDEDARKMVGESVEEHLIVKRLIKELRGLDGSEELFESKAAVLKESVEHHADEEENDLFPAAEKEFDEERLRELGQEMTDLKERLTARKKPARAASRGTARRA